MKSKRRLITGWRQVPVQKVRTRTGRPAATPAAGADPGPRAAVDPADEPGAHAPELPDPDK